MVLGKLPVPGCPTYFDKSRARAYWACSRCGWGCWDIFSFVYHFSFLSPSFWETVLYRLKYCVKELLSSKQPTKPPFSMGSAFKEEFATLGAWQNNEEMYSYTQMYTCSI